MAYMSPTRYDRPSHHAPRSDALPGTCGSEKEYAVSPEPGRSATADVWLWRSIYAWYMSMKYCPSLAKNEFVDDPGTPPSGKIFTPVSERRRTHPAPPRLALSAKMPKVRVSGDGTGQHHKNLSFGE